MTAETVQWLASFDPATLERIRSLPGTKWTGDDFTAAIQRACALLDFEPGDGTPEGKEIAELFAKMEAYEEPHLAPDEGKAWE